MYSKLLINVPLIFPVPLLVKQREALFLASLSIVIHIQPILWSILLLFLSIMLKNKELSRE